MCAARVRALCMNKYRGASMAHIKLYASLVECFGKNVKNAVCNVSMYVSLCFLIILLIEATCCRRFGSISSLIWADCSKQQQKNYSSLDMQLTRCLFIIYLFRIGGWWGENPSEQKHVTILHHVCINCLCDEQQPRSSTTTCNFIICVKFAWRNVWLNQNGKHNCCDQEK